MRSIKNTVCGLITQAGENMTDLESQELLLIREAVRECCDMVREIRNDLRDVRNYLKGWEEEKTTE